MIPNLSLTYAKVGVKVALLTEKPTFWHIVSNMRYLGKGNVGRNLVLRNVLRCNLNCVWRRYLRDFVVLLCFFGGCVGVDWAKK